MEIVATCVLLISPTNTQQILDTVNTGSVYNAMYTCIAYLLLQDI